MPREEAPGAVIVSVRSEHARGAAVTRRLRERARRYLASLDAGGAELSVLVVTDAAMRRLNRQWRGKDRPTDVLSFPSPGPGPFLGDVVISLDTAHRAAREEGRALGAELDRYLAHGLLHLLGHDHERPADARRMAAAEDALVGEGMVSAAGGAPESRSGSRLGSRSRSRSSSSSRSRSRSRSSSRSPSPPSPREAGRGAGAVSRPLLPSSPSPRLRGEGRGEGSDSDLESRSSSRSKRSKRSRSP